MNIFPPNVEAFDESVQIGESILASQLFEASDLDGNPITRFRFRDNSGVLSSGFFTVAGVRQPSNTFFQVSAAQLNTVRYHAGLIESSEAFSVQVGDAQQLSTVATATANTITGNFFPPTVIPRPGSVQERESLDPTTLFSVDDADGNPAIRFMFADRAPNVNGGHFRFNGVRMPSGQFFTVEANQLAQVEYIGGRFQQSENVAIRVFDGEFFSDIVDVRVTTLRNRFAPEVDVFNVNSGLGKVLAAESLFRFSDQDGNTPKTLGFLDTGLDADSGFFSINFVPQAAGTFFTVPADEIETVRYHVPNTSSDSEIFRVFATDGRFASEVGSGTVNAIPRPRLTVEDFQVENINIGGQTLVLDRLELVDFNEIVTQDLETQPLSLFQVMDQNINNDVNAARLYINGEVLQRGVIHTFTAEEFAQLKIRGGFPENRSANQFLVRGKNELFFTPWEEFRVNTEPNLNGALASNTRVSETLIENEKTVVTYTFIQGEDFTNDDVTTPPVPAYYAADAEERMDPFPLDPTMRNGIREALDILESYADLEFVEVPFEITASEAQITFGLTRGADDGVLGFTRQLVDGGFGFGNILGDVWFNRNFYPEFETPAGPGTGFHVTAIHEVGHVLGFKHPFTSPNAVPILLDNNLFSIMSGPDIPGIVNNGFALFDIFEVQRLYGPNEEFNTGNDHYFLRTPGTLTTLYDAGGLDTINMTSSNADEFISLQQGAFSSIDGNPFNVAISYGTVIENARGGSGSDTIVGNSSRNLLFGNNGDDTLEGDGGNDVLRGGARSDTYIWRTGDGRDFIDEQNLGGMDAIHIFDGTALSSLQNDLVFRKFGQNLRIDLRFDRREGQGSVVVKNQGLGGSRVETLRLFNAAGDQIGQDIDLFSIYQQATTKAQFFRVTGQETERGFIAVPT